jgi:hypothetical protein
MKRRWILAVLAVVIVSSAAMTVYASDYKGNDKEDTVFQRLGDLITGEYKVKGEPIKKTGMIQVVADEIKSTKPAPVE